MVRYLSNPLLRRKEADMALLITGTDGFMGKALKEYFQARGHEIFGTVFMREPLEDEIHFDIRSDNDFAKLPRKSFDAIIHTVGIVEQTAPKKQMFMVNAEGTRRMLSWARESGCKHFIQLSSISVYGLKTNGQDRAENKVRRYEGIIALPYMRSKAKAERYIEASGVPYTILRLPAVLGENDTYLSPAIVPRLQSGTFYFCGKKEKLFSVLYVKNLPLIVEKIIQAGPLNDAYNCASHHMAWREFISEYAKVLKVDPGKKQKSVLTVLTRIHDKKWALIMTFSRYGGHYPSKKLKDRLGGEAVEYLSKFSWQEGVRVAIEAFVAKAEKDPAVNRM